MRKREWPFPAYPNGWFQIGYSDELLERQVEPLEVFGRDLVLFRSAEGTPRVLDAHCRHLGAHMGYGGCVEEGGIRCPFHGWLWSADGECTDIPYAKKIPKGARIGAWAVCERNGLIYLWHHALGDSLFVSIAGRRALPHRCFASHAPVLLVKFAIDFYHSPRCFSASRQKTAADNPVG